MEFETTFTCKDATLFALSLGYGSSWKSYHDELRYVWEDHNDFAVVPTFVVALAFWSLPRTPPNNQNKNQTRAAAFPTPTTTSRLPPFPSPMMQGTGLIPPQALKVAANESISSLLDDCPVLHIRQAITWHHRAMSTLQKALSSSSSSNKEGLVCSCCLKNRFLSVQPKSVGTFVTSETMIRERSTNLPICTLESTTLLLGLPEDRVTPIKCLPRDSSNQVVPVPASISISIPNDQPCCWEQEIQVHVNQALVYRLASGDSNRIHVDPSSLPSFLTTTSSEAAGEEEDSQPKKPVLHGLATLGMAARVLEQFWRNELAESFFEFVHLEAEFRKLVLVGDLLVMRVWRVPSQPDCCGKDGCSAAFRVIRVARDKEETVVLDRGVAHVSTTTTQSKL